MGGFLKEGALRSPQQPVSEGQKPSQRSQTDEAGNPNVKNQKMVAQYEGPVALRAMYFREITKQTQESLDHINHDPECDPEHQLIQRTSVLLTRRKMGWWKTSLSVSMLATGVIAATTGQDDPWVFIVLQYLPRRGY